MKADLRDKTVMITGGASGIGLATARTFAQAGCNIAICDFNPDTLGSAVEQLQGSRGEVLALRVDVTSTNEVAAAVEEIVEKMGGIDAAVNNAGIGAMGQYLADMTEEDFDRNLSVNLKGVWVCLKYQIPAMLARGGGSIINMASALGLVGYTGGAAYVAAKHGVVGLTKAAAMEYSSQGVRVNAVCPGIIETPMTAVDLESPDIRSALLAVHPIGRFGQPTEVANAVLWLASSEASFVTGAALSVDGGWTAL